MEQFHEKSFHVILKHSYQSGFICRSELHNSIFKPIIVLESEYFAAACYILIRYFLVHFFVIRKCILCLILCS